MNKPLQTIKYIFFDWLAAAIAWFSFYVYRKKSIEPLKFGYDIPLEFDTQFYYAIAIIPVFWLIIYASFGMYRNVYRVSRLKEFGQILGLSVFGTLIIFFALLLDDEVATYKNYYVLYFTLFALHFGFTSVFRFILSSITAHKIHGRKMGFNTIIIGSNEKAVELFKEMEAQPKSSGNKFIGFTHVNESEIHKMTSFLPHMGNCVDLKKVVEENAVEEAIIAVESSEHNQINKIINELSQSKVIIKVIPDMYDILAGSVKLSSLYDAPLIHVNPEIMPAWQQAFKRVIDIFVSLCVLVIGFPIYFFTAIGVKLTSKGPIFFSQERIGQHGKPFRIYKFRSMYIDAEKHGPALSSKDDPRITPFGKWMRKTRLDEIPQFWNVLIGDMSLVGPRPERQFYIDQITIEAPHYYHLLKVKPGITSWGQVKYGYAENVEQMVQRLKYDILYIENMSLLIDFKILFYTVLIVLKGSGK